MATQRYVYVADNPTEFNQPRPQGGGTFIMIVTVSLPVAWTRPAPAPAVVPSPGSCSVTSPALSAWSSGCCCQTPPSCCALVSVPCIRVSSAPSGINNGHVATLVVFLPTRRTHNAIITLLLHQNDVATSFWRNNDVIIASYICWVYPMHCCFCNHGCLRYDHHCLSASSLFTILVYPRWHAFNSS